MRVFKDGESRASSGDAASQIQTNLAGIKAVVAFGSARGGVGKSSLTVNAAAALAQAGRRIGILDADLNSPSILAMLGIRAPRRPMVTEWIEPLTGPLGVRVVSVELMPDLDTPPVSFLDLEEQNQTTFQPSRPAAVEVPYTRTLRRMLEQSRLGPLDLLLVDLPPGLEAIARLSQLVPTAHLVILTHPSELAARAIRSIGEFAAANLLATVGVIENMAGFSCTGCHSVRPLMPQGAVAPVASDLGIPLIERLPFDPHLAETCDRGILLVREYPDSPLAKQLTTVALAIDQATRSKAAPERAAV